jgi:hypothetical protein
VDTKLNCNIGLLDDTDGAYAGDDIDDVVIGNDVVDTEPK